ncbi:conserved exported hypothetical protein [Alphaproteobacteria bacterium]
MKKYSKIFFLVSKALSVLLVLLASICANAVEERENIAVVKDQSEPSSEVMRRVKSFHQWNVFVENVKNGKRICHITSTPLYTKAFRGIRNIPYVVVSYIGPDMYTISAYAGFVLDRKKKCTVSTNRRTYMLQSAREFFAYTYSSSEDVTIINNMIEDNKMLEVRSYDSVGGTALDYYSLSGFIPAMRYVREICGVENRNTKLPL